MIAVCFLAVACTDGGADGTRFTLRGEVTAVQEGTNPPSELVTDEDDDDDERGEPDEAGTMVLNVSAGGDNLGECDLRTSSVGIFWTDQTNFSPAATADAADFPTNLNGVEVAIEGQAFGSDQEGGEVECVLIAEAVQVGGQGAATTSSPIPDRGAPDVVPSPQPTGSPLPTATMPTPEITPY